MIVKEMLENLRIPVGIEFRDSGNNFMCFTQSDVKGIEPYENRKIFEWFVFSKPTLLSKLDICILLEDEEAPDDNKTMV